MGWRVTQAIKAKCPLYEHVVSTNKGNIVGVQCKFICENFGFDASMIIRFRSTSEMLDAKSLFCDDAYESCPYYKAFVRAQCKKQK